MLQFHCQYVGYVARMARCTFGSQVFRPGHVVHVLQGLGLFPRKRLFVIVFTGSADAIEDDSAGASASGSPEDEDDEEDEDDGAKGRRQADDDSRQGRRW